MAKFHINSKGVPAVCKAIKGNCPFGGESGTENHYDTEKEAQLAADALHEKQHGILPSEINFLKKIENLENLEKRYNEIEEKIRKASNQQEEEKCRNMLYEAKTKANGSDKEQIELKDLFNNISSPDGGATVSIRDYKVTSPLAGFCASPYPQYSKVFANVEDIDYDVLMDYIEEVNEDSGGLFDQDETYLGLWNDPETGEVYLDVSKRYTSAQEARIACENHDQIAYFDLQLFESVDVDRNATSGQMKAM